MDVEYLYSEDESVVGELTDIECLELSHTDEISVDINNYKIDQIISAELQ